MKLPCSSLYVQRNGKKKKEKGKKYEKPDRKDEADALISCLLGYAKTLCRAQKVCRHTGFFFF